MVDVVVPREGASNEAAARRPPRPLLDQRYRPTQPSSDARETPHDTSIGLLPVQSEYISGVTRLDQGVLLTGEVAQWRFCGVARTVTMAPEFRVASGLLVAMA